MPSNSFHRTAIRVLMSLALAGLGSAAVAAPVSPDVRAEIDAVLASLASSGCKFNRNGDWHDGGEARTHLLRKLSYLEDKGAVKSTAQFIELAATKSSSSGKPYLVQCPGEASVPSSRWLTLRLMEVRKAPAQVAR